MIFKFPAEKFCRIIKKLGLVSSYTIVAFHPHKSKCNESPVKNELNHEFHNQELHAVVVNDLTYVRANYKWNYVCVLIDLFNREIIGFSAGTHKNAELVYEAFATIKGCPYDNAVAESNLKMFKTEFVK